MNESFSRPDLEPFDERFDVQHHPIRGLLWGLLAGIGLAIVLVVTKLISLSLVAVIVTVGVVMVLAAMWGVFGPPKPPSGPVPVRVVAGEAPPPSRFDDFGEPPADRPEHLLAEDPPGDRADGD